MVAEYNHSLSGALKNALDQAYGEWNSKPVAAINYGSGTVREVEHLRLIGIEQHMVSTRAAVHIGGTDFFAVFPAGDNQALEFIEQSLLPNAKAVLDERVWCARATMAARA